MFKNSQDCSPDEIQMFPKGLDQVVEVELHLAGDDHVVLSSSQPAVIITSVCDPDVLDLDVLCADRA